ncbi:MAG: M20/M25/M40 family metallo-hydrolase [Prevotellaceae bacterium]|jgi:Zn-dependent M28 family amino/carboxypeptidase|nr:M20/M25/M40 family metallo-hydrolase [Prevotellaceae bacterium]
MKTILLFIAAFFLLYDANGQNPKEIGLESINIRTAESIIYFLSHDVLKGREAGTGENGIAREYIISQLMDMGIKPMEKEGYAQQFEAYRSVGARRYKTTTRTDTVPGYTNKLSLYNILATIEGEKTDEYIIAGAHYDHLGIGKVVDNDSIYNGADDNASGVSAVLQIAKAFALSGEKPKRTLVFAFWDGEEKGQLGSSFFVNHCKYPDKIKAYLNFDMIGRNNDESKPKHVVYLYTEAYPEFGENTRQNIQRYKLILEPEYKAWDKPVTGSDQVPFALKNIPILWYHTDGHPDYHKPGDHIDKINWQKLLNITKAAYLNTWFLANDF